MILAATRDVDRPIFYSVAVIIAGYLPIYALTGPAGQALPSHGQYHGIRPDRCADSHAYVGAGARVLLVHERRSRTNAIRFSSGFAESTASRLDWCLGHPALTLLAAMLIFGASLLLIPQIGVEFLPHLDEGALWVRATMPYTISFEEAGKFAPKIRDILKHLSASDSGRLGTRPPRRRHRSHRFLQLRVLCRTAALH